GHLGGVHRWAHASLGTPVEGPPPSTDPAPADDLHAWFVDGATALGTTLRNVEPEQPCWGFGPKPRTASFWIRRQAHETAMHRWDAESAAGRTPSYDTMLAADGIDEVLTLMLPRQVRLGRTPEATGAVRLDADGRSFRLGDADPVGTVGGTADAVLLLLWGRIDPADPRLTVSGDLTPLDRALTP
ncbi:MAG: maleylpyruvate isomerase family mycothiol-dependent enzyme, partial [Nocardioidaceae bacterium]|nr:maleylpyruvate isomerase family mycothiol-dependent enzyme [Nocardioidaceae bacterium]